MGISNSNTETASQNQVVELLENSFSIRLLRGSILWGIRTAIFLIGIIAFPVVMLCFLMAGLALLPIMAFFQGIRFIYTFFGFRLQFPNLWSYLPWKRNQPNPPK